MIFTPAKSPLHRLHCPRLPLRGQNNQRDRRRPARQEAMQPVSPSSKLSSSRGHEDPFRSTARRTFGRATAFYADIIKFAERAEQAIGQTPREIKSGRPCRSRTCDQRIKSPLLYHLS